MSRLLPPAPLLRRGARLLTLLLLPALVGCSGTRFGDALSRSFSASTPSSPQPALPSGGSAPASPGGATTPQTSAPAGTAAAGTGTATAGGPRTAAPGGKPEASPTTPTGPAISRPPAGSATADGTVKADRPPAAGSTAPPRPAPYRVTILLPQADAAAPAEVVTQALRAAGVPFEVETIERLGRSTTTPPQAPVSRPAPEPR